MVIQGLKASQDALAAIDAIVASIVLKLKALKFDPSVSAKDFHSKLEAWCGLMESVVGSARVANDDAQTYWSQNVVPALFERIPVKIVPQTQ